MANEETSWEYTAISQCILISSVCVRVCVCEELHSGWQCGNSGAQSSLCFWETSPGQQVSGHGSHRLYPEEHAPAWHVPGGFCPESQFPQLDFVSAPSQQNPGGRRRRGRSDFAGCLQSSPWPVCCLEGGLLIVWFLCQQDSLKIRVVISCGYFLN